MSLLDSFLEEGMIAPLPPGSPRDIFIAIRNYGSTGSGTESDPYDGSTDAARGYGGTKYVQELEDAVEDVLLAL